MKFKLTIVTLLTAMAMHTLYADEPIASAPEALPTPAEPSLQLSSDLSVPASQVAAKPRKSSASTAAKKVATDYAPAQELLLSAMSLIGVKYKWGGNTPESGLDCSGFIRYVFQNTLNIALPRTALGMSRVGDTIDKDELKPGDLVFFNTLKRRFSHVGIYLGDNRFIHAPRTGRNIEITNMDTQYWKSRFNGARRMSELGHANLDIDALLKSLPEKPTASSKASTSKAATASSSCRKVTTTRNGKKVTRTVCSSKPSAKAAVKKSTAKTTSTASKKKAAVSSSKKKTSTSTSKSKKTVTSKKKS